ncbi:MAG: trigger factor [Clostridia bacterium]|nr:trigger factor [Clostridia bacterium]
MKVLKVEQREDKRMYLEIEIESAEFEAAMEKSYRKNVKQINIPGFRKGHAPRKIIEKYYTEAIFYDDAINFACPDAYDKAVQESNIDPVDMPEIDIVKLEKGENFVFSALVTVRPEVTLGEYKGITAEKNVNTVTDEEVDAEIKRMQENAARVSTVTEGEAAMGDKVDLDFEGFVDETAFEGGKGEHYSLVLGSNSFIPGFEEQIAGKTIGEDFDVNVTFPEDYHAEELKGKSAVFKCKVNSVEKKELPALDDEFAKDVSEFDTLDALKADSKAKLEKSKEEQAQRMFEDAVIDTAVENATVDIPQCMVDRQIDNQIQDISYRLQSQGMPLEQYLQFTGMTMESLREQLKETAQKAVKTQLVLAEIAKAEKVEVTDEDLENEYKKMADMYGMEVDKVRELMGQNAEALKLDLVSQKTVDLVVANAKAGKSKKTTNKAAAKKDDEAEEKKPVKKTTAKKTTAKKAEAGEEKKPAAKKTTKKTAAKKTEE